MSRLLLTILGLFLLAPGLVASAAEVRWIPTYREASRQAKAESRILLLVFYHPNQEEESRQRLQAEFSEPGVASRLDNVLLTWAATNEAVTVDGESIVLADHAAFAELEGRPGIAMIDYTDAEADHYGLVVSIYPFEDHLGPSPGHVEALLDLPHGSLTQRTLILAVRLHPQKPQSAAGEFLPLLAEQCASHSAHQARIQRQGHHNWESRFHQINARLPGRLVAQEVCAESWPNMGLYEAAVDCVASWRQSPGHWEAVRTRHKMFGYDMKRGKNGIWYATGIFARDD